MVSTNEVVEVAQRVGFIVSYDAVANALEAIDQDFIYSQERQKYTSSVWDNVSSINGESAESLFTRYQIIYPAAVFLIGDVATGKTTYFQPFDCCNNNALMSLENVGSCAMNFIEMMLVEPSATSRIITQVLTDLGYVPTKGA